MLCYARFGTICKFKKREKHPWKSVTFSKVAGFSKLRNASQIKYIPKIPETAENQTFSGGIEMEYWRKMGQIIYIYQS